MKFVNLAALLLMAGSLWLIIEMTIDRWWIAVITFAAILLNTSILSLQNKLWSDPLALATSSASIASAMIACRGDKNWWRWICVASVFLSIAICIRYAMLPGIPVLLAVAFWLSKRTASHREAVLLPLFTPLLTFISFYFLRSSSTYPRALSIRSVTSMGSFDFPHYWSAFVQMADQVLPVAFVATWLSIIIVAVALIAVPVGTAFVTPTSQQRSALLISVGYVLLSCIFLALVPIVSTFPIWDGLSLSASDLPFHSYRSCYCCRPSVKQATTPFPNISPHCCWVVEHGRSAIHARGGIGNSWPQFSQIRFMFFRNSAFG